MVQGGDDEASEQHSAEESFLVSSAAKLAGEEDAGTSDSSAPEPRSQQGATAAADSAAPAAADKAPASSGPDLSSVITQVTTRAPPSQRVSDPRTSSSSAANGGAPSSSSWKFKVRSLFCCLAPSPHAYSKQHEAGDPPPRVGIPVPASASRDLVMGPKRAEDADKKTLVLDLDETLVHSSFKPIPNPDYIIPVEIDGKLVDVYVLKRPFMDHFMEAVGTRYEVVVFTASLSKYADPLLDLLDKTNTIRWRLFRESCCPYEGNYVKDLTCLGRDLAHTIIVDNSPHSYAFQPANALPVGTFIDNMEDQELLDMLPVLANIEHAADVRPYLGQYVLTLGPQ